MNQQNEQTIKPVAMDALSIAEFEPLRHQEFTILFSAQQKEEAVLADIVPLTGYTTLPRKPFSILLQTSQQKQYFPQAIYSVFHPALGKMEMFLVPLGAKQGGMQYEAVFS